jgi:(heptosyl)LPS beta-1,4-glucosyltransferase
MRKAGACVTALRSVRSVSAVIITRNEERTMARCLASLAWADEILVVDAESTDRTREICLAPGQPWSSRIRLLTRAWTGFREQRNYAITEAAHDWVLVVDSDEECSPELARKVRDILAESEPHRYHKVRRIEYFLGKAIHYGIWNPSYQDRFFHRKGVAYVNEVHEYPVFPQEPLRIHEPLHHDPAFSVERFLDKMNRYTSIEARDRVRQGKRTNWFRVLFAFPAMFWKNYFYYQARKDGIHGLVISVLEGVSRAVRHSKMWQYQRERE